MLLKLDTDKPREARFKQYLDDNTSDGINRKESLLRLFEIIDVEAPTHTPIVRSNVETEIREGNEEIKEFKTENLNQNVDSDEFDGI